MISTVNIHNNSFSLPGISPCFFLVILNCGVYIVFFYKITSINEKYFNSYKSFLLLSAEIIVNSHSHLVKCVVIRVNNVWNWRDRWAIVVLNRWSIWIYVLQALILPCILFCVWLICDVSVFLIVYYWTRIISKWFISYDDGFWFAW